MNGEPIMRVKGLTVRFPSPSGEITAVDDISFEVRPGQILGIVGESGSGKSVTCRAALRMVRAPGRVDAGRVLLGGKDVLTMSETELRSHRGATAAMVFQDPQSSLDPVKRVGDQVMAAMRVHGVDRATAAARAVELLDLVGIPDPAVAARRYPHEFSGGMRQRVVIAIALANRPSVLIADEPTTALDVTIQAQVLALLRSLRDRLGIAIIMVTHDLGVVAEVCDDVLVMNEGRIVERGRTKQVLGAPREPYARMLLSAVPRMDADIRPTPESRRNGATMIVRDLRTDVTPGRHGWRRRTQPTYAVDGVTLEINSGETLGLVGESGCGKSTLSRTLIGIIPATSGSVELSGHDVTSRGAVERRQVARTVQYVFQDPYASLNPRRSAGQSIDEALEMAGVPAHARADRCRALLGRVGLPADAAQRYPRAFSGGQRQRIAIARALAAEPDLIILDEPVSALDVSVQAQVLDLLLELQDDLGLGYLFISHDLAVIRQASHRVAVMRAGRIVEHGTTADVFERPAHDYTRSLLASTLTIDLDGASA